MTVSDKGCPCCDGFGYHEADGGTPACGGRFDAAEGAYDCQRCDGNGTVDTDA